MKIFLLALVLSATLTTAGSTERPTVLELYTSQSCSSCPPADKVLKRLADDRTLLPLSFHVDYWNYLSWTDTLSSPANTVRQSGYAPLLGTGNFTPQLIIDGSYSTNGGDRLQVDEAIDKARETVESIPIIITSSQNILNIKIPAKTINYPATIWEFRYNREVSVLVNSGENGGRTVTSTNPVISIKKIASWKGEEISYDISGLKEDGIAIIIQKAEYGQIIGAANYLKK